MALIYIDGFDTYRTADLTKRWTSISVSPAIAASGRTASGVEINANSEYLSYGVTQATTYLMGAAFKVAAIPDPAGYHFLSFDGASLTHIMLMLQPSGAISAYRGGATVYPLSTNSTTNMTILGTPGLGPRAAGAGRERPRLSGWRPGATRGRD